MMKIIISKMTRRKRNWDLRYIDSYEKNFFIDFFFLVGTLDEIDFILRYRMRRNGKEEFNRHPTGAWDSRNKVSQRKSFVCYRWV